MDKSKPWPQDEPTDNIIPRPQDEPADDSIPRLTDEPTNMPEIRRQNLEAPC